MKLIIAGSRHLRIDRHFINSALIAFDLIGEITEIIHGDSGCVDLAGRDWGYEMNYLCGGETFTVTAFPAKWEDLDHPNTVIKTRSDGTQYNSAAGPIRNGEMADVGDRLMLIWDGKSKGSANMKKEMQLRKKPIYEIIMKGLSNG
jgi:hypothetical protein